MSAPQTAFAYDEFERFLLDTAKQDHAPPDLPARLGVALGLSVPILVATEVATTLPTFTTASGATLKASWGLGAPTLFATAAKGIALGLLSGAALLGTGHAVAKLTEPGPRQLPAATAVYASTPTVQRDSRSPQKTALRETPTDEPASTPVVEAPTTTGKAVLTAPLSRSGIEPTMAAKLATAEPPLARPSVPEKTTAIARFAPVGDDVGATYDAAKQSVQAPVTPAVAPLASLSSADLSALRKETLTRVRTLLGQGKAAKALAELDGFRTRVGAKNFGVGELLLRIESLAILGRAKEAQANVAIVERLAPASAALRQAQQLARSRFVR